jgi:glycosyltransferase involved in cell wall biosynthesis
MHLLLFNLATDADDPVLGFTIRWIQALAQRVQRIDVITMRCGRVLVPDNVRVYSVGKEKGYSELRRTIEFYRILNFLLAQNRYDACFAHMMQLFAVMAHPLLRSQRVPTILWYAHKSVTPLLRTATYLVDRVVTTCEKSFRVVTPKVQHVGQGIDTDFFTPDWTRQDDRSFTILTVGRLSPIKQLDKIIAAISLLRHKHPELPLVFNIVGKPLLASDHLYETNLRQQVEQENLQNCVHFLGSRCMREIVPVYQQADCFVNMSATGSPDKAVLEAMSCGIPVIANPDFSRILGAELSRNWVVEWNVEQLCDRLFHLSSLTVVERQQLGERLREIVVRDHNLDKLCDRLVQEFQAVRHSNL